MIYSRDELLPINLSFFDEGEKTEQPTARKREKARKKGQVAKSPEVNTALLFLAAFFGLRIFSENMYVSIANIFSGNFQLIADIDNIMEVDYIAKYIAFLFTQIILICLPIFALSMGVGIISNLFQVGWHPTIEPLMPKFSKLSPISGFKRLFSMRVLVELLKSLAKFGIIGYVIYATMVNEINYIPQLASMGLMQAIIYLGNVAARLGLNIGLLFLFVALADVFYTRYKHTKDLKMSKQEVKDEYKSIEGNPQIKGKIRQKMREVSMRRMMQSVPSADVVVTNPTHYAVALKYDKNVSDAPYVVAKGVDFLAQKIKNAALQNGVEIVENVQLARTLYATVDVGKTIPEELYQTVAEILAFVYKLKNYEGVS